MVTLNRNICYSCDRLDSQSPFQRREKAKGEKQLVFKEQQELWIICFFQHFPLNRTFLWVLQAGFKTGSGLYFLLPRQLIWGQVFWHKGTLGNGRELERPLFPREQGPFFPATRACAFHPCLTGEAALPGEMSTSRHRPCPRSSPLH